MATPSTTRVTLADSERVAPHNATDLGRTPPQQLISVSVILKRKNDLHLDALGGRHISRQEFNEKYAADPAHFSVLRKFAHDHGLSVDEGPSSASPRPM